MWSSRVVRPRARFQLSPSPSSPTSQLFHAYSSFVANVPSPGKSRVPRYDSLRTHLLKVVTTRCRHVKRVACVATIQQHLSRFAAPPSTTMFLSLLSSRILPGILLLSFLSRVHSQSDPGASFSVDTPSSVGQCDTAKFTWKGGQAPFTLDVVFQENSSVFQDFNRLSGSPLAWEATVPAGTVLVLSLYSPDDIGGDYVRLSNPFTIQAGNDSCLGSTTPRSKTNIVATSSGHTTTSRGSSTGRLPTLDDWFIIPTDSALDPISNESNCSTSIPRPVLVSAPAPLLALPSGRALLRSVWR
ncbi:hypothetical protein LXA43DRAFT_367775 [Ganoderma leucocontextum]|nr:hypothetical protein LXA43DRAFT_367775 [Ganoderma leucocontextum]